MGRKKRSLISMSIRNKKVISHRWNRSESQSKTQSFGSNVSIRPCLVDHLISKENIEIEVDPNDCLDPDEPKNTPTGFALYNSYRPNEMLTCPLNNKQKTLVQNKTQKRLSQKICLDSSTDEEDESFVSDPSGSDFSFSDLSQDEDDDLLASKVIQPSQNLPKSTNIPNLKAGDFVAAVYEGEWFLASVLSESPVVQGDAGHTYYNLSFAQIKGQNKFIWPEKRDDNLTLVDDILCAVSPPIPVSSRHIGLIEADYSKVKKLLSEKRQQLGIVI